MKKVFIILVSFFVLFGVVCYAYAKVKSEKSIKFKSIEEIEKELQSCLDENYSSSQCNIEAQEKYEAQIKVALEKLKKVVTAQQYDEILKTQQKWEELKTLNKQTYDDIIEAKEVEAGTLVYLYSSQIQANNAKRRLQELNELYSAVKYIYDTINE